MPRRSKANKSRSRSMRRYWRRVKRISREENVSIKDARRFTREGQTWKIIIEVAEGETGFGRFEYVDFVSGTEEHAKDIAYEHMLKEEPESGNWDKEQLRIEALPRQREGSRRFKWSSSRRRKRTKRS